MERGEYRAIFGIGKQTRSRLKTSPNRAEPSDSAPPVPKRSHQHKTLDSTSVASHSASRKCRLISARLERILLQAWADVQANGPLMTILKGTLLESWSIVNDELLQEALDDAEISQQQQQIKLQNLDLMLAHMEATVPCVEKSLEAVDANLTSRAAKRTRDVGVDAGQESSLEDSRTNAKIIEKMEELMERNLMMEEMDDDSEEFVPPAHLSDKIEKIMRAIGKKQATEVNAQEEDSESDTQKEEKATLDRMKSILEQKVEALTLENVTLKTSMARASEQNEDTVRRLQNKIDQLMAERYADDKIQHARLETIKELQSMLKFNTAFETKKSSLFSQVEDMMSARATSDSQPDLQLRIDQLESLRQADMEYIAELEDKVIFQKKKILQLESLLLQPRAPDESQSMR
mmetsp:Transcript_14739/g.50284  ORF Transcript_14739/g.50284 Transcript_14739/m.50284 type:complete len:405 (-) Transcript_14739:66-1280(-)